MISGLLEKNVLPDFLIRFGIRRRLGQRLAQEKKTGTQAQADAIKKFVAELKKSPIAVYTQEANRQHYELPTDFFKWVLGRHLKYSSGYWRPAAKAPYQYYGMAGLDLSEKDMLEICTERTEIYDGMNILDLGCGWGSWSLYLAKRFPKSSVTALSNSSTQKAYIDEQARLRGLRNLTVITENITHFESKHVFDRVVSVEMFEHLRNYELLFEKISRWLKPEGKLFVHIFCHKQLNYFYDHTDPDDWIAQYFFTGGMMPGFRLFDFFNRDLKIQYRWQVSGTHYQKTCRAWLKNMDAHKSDIWPILEKTYGSAETLKWWVRWRVFFMACEELFGFKNGSEWFVGHYLFVKC